jgi:hypothetical protein
VAFTMSRVDKRQRTYTVADSLAGTYATVDVALLRVGASPTVATVWSSVPYAAGVATVVWSGPDADATGAVVVPASADVWMKGTAAPYVEAVKVERITVLGGGAPLAVPTGVPVVSVNGKKGATVVLGASDVLGAVIRGPDDPSATLPIGIEYVWMKTDGAGTLLDIVSGVA